MRLLVATDGSSPARDAVAFGLELAARQGAEVSIVHVVPAAAAPPTAAFGSAQRYARPTSRDELALEDAAALASHVGVAISTELLTGNPVDEIVAYADSIDADLIVVGSRGHGAVESELGSVLQEVLEETRRSVLVVRRSAAEALQRSRSPCASA